MAFCAVMILTVAVGITAAQAPDWVLDQWHPWEKVQMMDYFEKREKLKEEFNEYYEKSLTKKYQPEAPAPVV